MIKKELEIIRETEQQCKELLAEAELERQRILHDAQEEVRLRREELVRAAHEEGMRHLEEAAAREAAERAARLTQWEERRGSCARICRSCKGCTS